MVLFQSYGMAPVMEVPEAVIVLIKVRLLLLQMLHFVTVAVAVASAVFVTVNVTTAAAVFGAQLFLSMQLLLSLPPFLVLLLSSLLIL
jgi:hypothetical protein